ncbi:hypothetical protein [Bifidobacterium catulorum]|uniref:Signal transduction histidine kinase subgroup 3 dimerisation and phosphoacceptor domain-containing protein n=1 Tax=Bifidobacterium catulorum TaxID=1630173 RepID=A0A2U2MQW6_9BIFI|nr:hypothetical protein [Bifidobacterium catulorum]PWG59247.1 hypothetical protein DF200_08610 [Bifidobacterium catulorum]
MTGFKGWLQDRASNIDFVTLLIAVVVVVSLLEWQMNPPHRIIAVLCSLAHIFAVLLMRFRPIEGGGIVVFIYCCFSLLPLNEGVSQYWGVWVALGFLGYHRFWKNGLAMMMAAVLARMLQYCIFQVADDSLIIAMMMSCSFVFAWCIGGLMHRRIDMERDVYVLREERRRYQKERQVETRIHDAVSGELAYAILLSQDKTLPASETVRKMREALEKAAGSLYQVMDCLDAQEDMEPLHGITNVMKIGDLRSILDSGKERLQSLGREGTISIAGDSTGIPERYIRFLCDLVRELLTNIMRHTSVDDVYFLGLIFDRDNIRVVQTNTCTDNPRTLSHGYGMKNLDDMIHLFRGEMHISKEDGSWVYNAVIPVLFSDEDVCTATEGQAGRKNLEWR